MWITANTHRVLSAIEQAAFFRELANASRVKDPTQTDLEKRMQAMESELALSLRTPADADIADRVRHIVWPIGALILR